MTRFGSRTWLAGVIVTALVGGFGFGCSKGGGGTFVVLDIKGGSPALKGIRSIDVALTLGGKTAMATFPAPGNGDITLPTTGTLEIGSGSGALSVSATARDKAGAALAVGTGTGTVTAGATTHVTVQLGGGSPDGGAGTGGGGSDGSAGGGGSTDGPPTEGGTDGGPTPPQLATDKAMYDFGTQLTSATGAGVGSTVVTVTNTGGQKTGSLIVGVIDAATFPTSADMCSGMTLDPGASCTVTVKFMPGAAGAKSSKLQVGATPGGMAVVNLSGMAVDPGALALTPDHGTFDPLPQGQSSAEAVFTVKNTGGAGTSVLTATLTGTSAGEFKLSSDTCTGQMLGANMTCTVGVKFSPTAAGVPGVESAVLSVSAMTGGTATANLSGTVLGPAAISIVPTDQDFLMVVQGQTSAEFPFTVTNKGGVTSGALVTGVSPMGEFTISSDTCNGMTLAPNGTCKIGVKMTPAGTGARSAMLNVRATPGGNASASLRGTGLAPGMIVLSPQPKDFGIVDVGQQGTVPFTVTNTGGAATTALSVKLTGATEFTLASDTCTNMTLAPNAMCTFRVVFSAAAFGPRAATLTASAATGGTSSSALTAKGRDYVTLTVTKNGSGAGTVAATGLTCTNNVCTGSYPRTDPAAFTTVNLTAAPDSLSTFASWAGAGCSGAGACQVKMDQAQAVTASFVIKQVLITATNISISGHTGTVVTDDGAFSCASDTCGPEKHKAQASISFVAKAGTGSTFAGWASGPCKGTNPTCTLPLTSDVTITATFGPQAYMFVTSSTVIPGRLGGIAGADAECTARATAAGLPGVYKAWISDLGVDAIGRVGKGGWLRTDGRPFTRSAFDLKAGNQIVYYPPRVDENGNDLGPKRISVVTGGSGQGTSFGVTQCGGYMTTAGSAYIGMAAAGSSYWAYNELDGSGCGTQQHLYCFRTDTSVSIGPAKTPGRYIFISDNAVMSGGGIDAFDKECQIAAKNAGIATFANIVAFLGTSGTAPMKRVDPAGLPWKRPDEVLVVLTPGDLATGNLLSPIDVAADGLTYKNPQVWTGSVDPTTGGVNTCGDWKSTAANATGQFGYPNSSQSPEWFNSGTLTCDNKYGWVICIEP